MSRLVDDPSKVGPGSYFLNDEYSKMYPKSTINWGNSRSQRIGIPSSNTTSNTVGPGSYNNQSMINRSITNPSIPREGVDKSGKLYSRNIKSTTSASIKHNYIDDEDEDEYLKPSPGPGDYMTETSTFRTKRVRPGSLQLFGSNVSRFNEKPIGTHLGPGQYKVPNRIGIKNNSAIAKIGSAAFRSPERPEPIQM